MKCNMGKVDRIIRIVIGILLIAGLFFVSGTLLKAILGIIGLVMILTAATGFCPLYVPFGISTCKTEK